MHRIEMIGFFGHGGRISRHVLDRRKHLNLHDVPHVVVGVDRAFAGVTGVVEHRVFSGGTASSGVARWP